MVDRTGRYVFSSTLETHNPCEQQGASSVGTRTANATNDAGIDLFDHLGANSGQVTGTGRSTGAGIDLGLRQEFEALAASPKQMMSSFKEDLEALLAASTRMNLVNASSHGVGQPQGFPSVNPGRMPADCGHCLEFENPGTHGTVGSQVPTPVNPRRNKSGNE